MRYRKISLLCVIIFFLHICGGQEDVGNVGDDKKSDVQDDYKSDDQNDDGSNESHQTDDIQRIHAGVRAKVGDYKFVLGFKLDSFVRSPKLVGRQTSVCTASIIGRRSILTAGHCIPYVISYCMLKGEEVAKAEGYSFSGITFTFYVGTVDMSIETGATLQKIQVTHPDEVTIHVHPEAFTFIKSPEGELKEIIHNDFLLLQLQAKEIIFNDYVQPIPLLKNPIPPRVADLCKAVGFGNQDDIKRLRDQLLYSILVVVGGPEYCDELKGKSANKQDHVCAFGMGMKDTCSGDSGGPLVCGTPDSYYLVGVLSLGTDKTKIKPEARLRGCGETNTSFGVYGYTGVVESWLQSFSTEVKYITHEEAEAMQKVEHARPIHTPSPPDNNDKTTTPFEDQDEVDEGYDETPAPKIKPKVKTKRNDASYLQSSQMSHIMSKIVLLSIVLCNNGRYE